MSANTRDPYEPAADYRPAGRTPALILLAIAIGGGVFLWWRTRSSVEPTRVLVAIDIEGQWWQGSAPAAKASDEVAGWLRDLGFDPVRAGDPAVTTTLEKAPDPVAAAKALNAGFVISAKFVPQLVEHPVAEGYFEARAEGAVRVVQVNDPAGGIDQPVQGWAGAKSKESALESLAQSVALRTFDAALGTLVAHPKLSPFFEPTPRNVPPERLQQLKDAREFVASRERKLQTAEATYKSLGERRAGLEKGEAPVTYHGRFSADDALCGTSAAGYLVRSAPITPFVSPHSGELGRISGLESLEWRKPGEATPKALWTGYNVYGYPAAAPEGAPVVLVEDIFGWAKAVTVIDAGGRSNRLKVDPEHRYSAPSVAPGGAHVALEDRACRSGCPGELVVLSLADGKEAFRQGPETGSFGGHAWLDAKRLVFLHDPTAAAGTPPAGAEPEEGEAAEGAKAAPAAAAAPAVALFNQPRQTLWMVDLGGDGRPVPLLTVGEGESLSWLKSAHDGRQLAAAFRGTKFTGLATLEVTGATAQMKSHDVGGEATSPAFSPDGARIAFNLLPVGADDDEEIAVMAAAGGPVKRLTDNPFRDRYPAWSSDGATLFFESIDRDPNFPRNRNVSVIASVAAGV